LIIWIFKIKFTFERKLIDFKLKETTMKNNMKSKENGQEKALALIMNSLPNKSNTI